MTPMQCPYCHAKNKDDARRCKRCSKRLHDADGNFIAPPPRKERVWTKALAMVLVVGVLIWAFITFSYLLPHWQSGDTPSSESSAPSATPSANDAPTTAPPHAGMNLDTASVQEADPTDGADAIIGHWHITGNDVTIEKIGYHKYRVIKGDIRSFLRCEDNGKYTLDQDGLLLRFTLNGNRLVSENGGNLGYRR